MVSSPSPFVKSTIIVEQNAVKSILFRTAAMLLRFSVYKLFALAASRKKAFMPYLMFTEDVVQQALYLGYNFLKANGLLVLGFAVLFALAGVFDTFLWYLDAPGYAARQSRVNARSVADQLLPQPDYVVVHSTTPGNVTALDAQLEEVLGSSLFRPGFNFSLTTEVRRGAGEVVPPTPELLTWGPGDVVKTGPRIWLDEAGFSVSADSHAAFVSLNASSNRFARCNRAEVNVTGLPPVFGWSCTFPNDDALATLDNAGQLEPEIHWDHAADQRMHFHFLAPPYDNNPWGLLSKGGGTVLMKQVFTISKGNRRHTFLHTAFKASMVADFENSTAVLTEASMVDLLTRAHDPRVPRDDVSIRTTAQNMVAAHAQNKSFSQGGAFAYPDWLQQESVELLNVRGLLEEPIYSLVRLTTVHIRLVRSETLPAPVQPLEPCERYYRNVAVGGRAFKTDCALAFDNDQTEHRFLGQVDNTAMFILNGFFGARGTSSSAAALNATGFAWLLQHSQRLDDLVLARAYLAAIDPGAVTLLVSSARPAMSYLQLTLVLAAAVVALFSYIAVALFATRHYASSLLATLCATTAPDDAQPRAGRKPRYLWRVPDIRLAHEGARMVMETEAGGIYRLDRAAAVTGSDAREHAAGAELRDHKYSAVNVACVAPDAA